MLLGSVNIDLSIIGASATQLIESYTSEDMQVRTFYDSGILRFATLDDIMIESKEDSRIGIMSSIVNDPTWPHDHPIHELFDEYEGSLAKLFETFKTTINFDASVKIT